MKIIAYIDSDKVLAEVSPSDVAGIAGLSQYHLEKEFPKGCMTYSGFTSKIVGKEIEPGHIYEEAVAALGIIASAQKATEQLRDAANSALGFFQKRQCE